MEVMAVTGRTGFRFAGTMLRWRPSRCLDPCPRTAPTRRSLDNHQRISSRSSNSPDQHGSGATSNASV